MEVFSDRIKGLASQLGTLAQSVEKFVENNLVEKEQRDQNLRKLTQFFDTLISEQIKKRALEPVEVKVTKESHFKGELPRYETLGASGMDVCAQLSEPQVLEPGQRALIPTGLKMEIPKGYEVQVRPRSGWALREGIGVVNSPGTIDADYRGEVKVILVNLGQDNVEIKDQMRVAQLVLCPVVQAQWVEEVTLGETDRGEGGFGSTGKES